MTKFSHQIRNLKKNLEHNAQINTKKLTFSY